MEAEQRLAALGLQLPEAPEAIANYVGAVRTGNLLFLSGRGPRRDGKFVSIGKLGQEITIEQGYEAAQLTMLNLLATLKSELGDLDRVSRVVKLTGMVNAVPTFTDHPQVINGASDLLVRVFGDKGRHARAAFGVGSLPLNTSVEIEMVVEVA
ncbi:MAG TPA: RidA family protein [Chloroflexota bacterium]|nr:RidA family protein [Chloroflexota bacterium]